MTKRSSSKHVWTPREKIEKFLEKVEEFQGTRLISSGFNISLKIGWDYQRGPSTQLTQIHDDDLRSYLTVFRHFISPNEPMCLYAVFDVCRHYLNNDSLKTEFVEIRKYWKASLEKNGMRLELDGSELKPEEIINLWINGWSHHNEPRYQELVKCAPADIRQIQKGFLLDALVESGKVILVAGEAVSCAYNNACFTFD